MARWRTRVALLALLAIGVGIGCLGSAERTYFDDLLDGSVDGAADVSVHVEASSVADGGAASDGTVDVSNTSDDAPVDLDAAVVVDSEAVADAADAADAADGADGAAVPKDASADAPSEAEAGCGSLQTVSNCGACGTACDRTHSSPASCTAGTCSYSGCDAGWGDCVPAAPNTNGCETQLNSIAHCSACNVACDTTNSLGAGCSGTTCTYTACKPGWSMCKTTAPNAGGCACNTPGCCVEAGTCQTTHGTGLGQAFYDCSPLNTWTDKSAREACAAYTGNPNQCTDDLTCTGSPDAGPYVCNGALNNNCDTCWSYGGTDIGTVSNCDCPGKGAIVLGTYN